MDANHAPPSTRDAARAVRRWRLLVLLCLCCTATVHAHELESRVGRAEAVVLQLRFAGAQPFADQAYQIYYADEIRPRQVGRSDAQGRIVFLPDAPGPYRIKTQSEDGHGGVYALELDAAGGVVLEGTAPADRWTRALTGVALVFGGFGVLAMFLRGARA